MHFKSVEVRRPPGGLVVRRGVPSSGVSENILPPCKADYKLLLTEFINLPSTSPKAGIFFLVQLHIGGYQSPQCAHLFARDHSSLVEMVTYLVSICQVASLNSGSGCGSLVVTDLWLASHEFHPSPLKTPRAEGAVALPTVDVVSRVFRESSALEQVVAIHPDMASERTDLVSSQAKPVEVFSQNFMSGDWAKVDNSLGIRTTAVRVFKVFDFLGQGIYQCM
ncbi:hypothetical protein TNCV_2232051 [Trichonephila clavipes]|nr:hypothetical protein TNCV_2232051 [Trichonephila clavipes]